MPLLYYIILINLDSKINNNKKIINALFYINLKVYKTKQMTTFLCGTLILSKVSTLKSIHTCISLTNKYKNHYTHYRRNFVFIA